MSDQKKGPEMKKGTFARLMRYIFAHYSWKLIVVLFCIIISSISTVVATVFLQRLIDQVITPGITAGLDSVWDDLVQTILFMVFIYAAGVIASFTYTRIMAGVTQGTLKDFRADMFHKMETLPIKYFDTNAHGDIMSTYTNDTDAIRQLIGQSLPMLFQTILSVTSMLIMMLCYSIWLTIAVGIISISIVYVTRKFAGASAKYMMIQQKTLAAEEGFIEEMMNGQKVVKVFCHEEESKEDFKRINEELFEAGKTANANGNILMPIIHNIGNIMYVLLALIGGLMVYSQATNVSLTGTGVVTIGIIVSFLNMSRQLSQTIGQASMQVPMIAMGLAGANRVFELLDQEPEYDEGYVTLVYARKNEKGELEEAPERTGLWAWKHPHKAEGTVTYEELKGCVELENVDFGYVPEKMVLHDISLYAKPGQKIAFVGATGAGKTTITNLINRFYDIPDGKIRYDGININKIKKHDLRHSLGIVLQDVNLFTGTVMDNIRYGRLVATDEECIEAAKLANAHGFIERLPNGYQTILTGNGSSLSQGQRQLISIARAAVANHPVMILDEATSSIDTRTEALVSDGMDNLMEGRTVFVIAHRLSTVRNSDAIMVLDHGRIIERGNHEDLIAQKGIYYQLYTGAFELE
ncbi:MAG: ABC transporter ATP-binding protein [Lachnospiraceae bacterium]|nr:ABC transporter ATP-binding protein [Lachnospiraceae bacterium]